MESLTLERVLNLVTAKIAVLDSEFKYVFLNDALAKSLCVPKETLLGSVLGKRNHPNSEALRAKLKELVQNETSALEFRLDFADPTGALTPHHCYLSQLPQENQHKYVILSVDVTYQLAMEARLAKKLKTIQTLEQYLQALINTIPDPIYVRGLNQEWVDANDAFLALSGLTKAELISRRDFDYLPPETRGQSAQMEALILANPGSTARIEEEIVLKDGSKRYFSAKRQSRVLPDGRQVVIGVLHDITDQKRKTLEAEQATKLNHFSSRLESLSQMASRISHEINNPLTIIKLTANVSAERIKRGQLLNADQMLKAFSDVENASDRIAKLLLAMRAMAQHPGEVSVKSFAVGPVIKKTLPFCLELNQRKEVNFKFVEGTSGARLVTSNEAAFSQALIHVLKNAYEALASKRDGKVELRIESSGSFVGVFIKDNGDGIPEDIVGRIFEPFFSTKLSSKGLGLGLSLSRQSIRATGGDLHFNTGPWGTEFEIRLPAAREAVHGK